jgi:hypothetical protein
LEKINGPLTSLPFTVTVQTDYDVAGMLVFVQASDVRVIFEPADVWTVDAIANEPVVITSTVTFPQEGSVMFTALAQDSQRGLTVGIGQIIGKFSSGGEDALPGIIQAAAM